VEEIAHHLGQLVAVLFGLVVVFGLIRIIVRMFKK